MGQLRSPSGEIVTVPDDQVEHAIAGGYTPVSTTEAGQSTGAVTQEDTGALGAVGAGLSSLASGATLGLSDLAAKGLLNRGHFEDLALQREQHPIVSGIGQVAGTVLPSLLAPGSTLAAAPAGLLSRAAVGATEQFGGGLAAKAVVGSAEGALYNAGAYLSDTALGDRDLTAEGLSGALGAGFAFGAAGAVGMHGVEAGTIAARRMFARVAEGGEKAALDASSAWERASQSTLEANDAAADAARAKLAEAKLATQQAGVARDQAAARVATERAAAPGADAEFSQARILDENIAKVEASEAQAAAPGPEVVIGNHDDLANLLAEHDAARADFERVLASLQAPEVGQAGGRIEKIAGKFGEPELAAGTPAPVSIRDALDARARQVEATSVGKRPAAVADVNPNAYSGSLEDLLRGTKAQIDGGKSLGEVAGRPPLADVPASTPSPRATAPSSMNADNSLESLLAGTKAKLDEGQSLGEIASGSKLRKDYVTSKELEVGKPLTEGPLATASAKTPAAPAKPFDDSEFKDYKKEYGHAAADSHYAAEMYYSKGGDELVNPALRSGKPLDEESAKLRDGLDDAFGLPESRLPRDATLYRGLSSADAAERFANVKPGDVVQDPAYTSTAFSESAKSRNEEVVFTISAPKGTPALPIRSKYSSEGELLLPRDTRLRVDAVDYVPISERWTPTGKFEVLPDKSVRVTYKDGSTEIKPPIKDIKVTIVSEHVPSRITRAPRVDRFAPIDELSKRQIGQYQDDLTEALKSAPRDTPEYEALSKQWDGAVARRNAIDDGKIADPPEWAANVAANPKAKSDVPEYAAVKAHETKLDAEFEQTLPASAISERGYYEPPGGHNDAVRTANAKKAIAEGQQEAIKLNVTPSGKITVTNGRHRLQAAIEADAPIKVKWSTGFEPSAELDVFRGGAKAAEAAHVPAPYDPGADLEALLAKHVAERDGSAARGFPATAKGDVEQFPTGDAPLDSSYEFSVKHKHIGDTPLKLSVGTKPPQFGGSAKVFVKVERVMSDGEVVTMADAELFHRANGDLYPESVHVEDTFHRLGIATRMYEAAEEASGGKLIPSNNQTEMGAAFSKKFRGARDAAPVEGGSFKDAAPDRTSHFDIKSSDLEFDPKSRTYRDKAGASSPLGYRQAPEVVRDPALEQAMRAADEAHPFAAKQLEQRLDAAHDLAVHAPDAATRESALAEASTIERQLTAVGARPGVVEDAALMAPIATRYEKASAAMTEALGDAAPPAARAQAQAFRAAEDAAERKTMDRTTRAIDDANDPPVQVGKDRRPGSLKSSAERVNAAKADKLKADAVLAQARAGESEAKLGARAADLAAKAAPPAGQAGATSKVGGAFGALRTAGTALEVAADLGVPGVPHPKDIPVIGPLLSVYLKYRALKAAAGRFTGRVPATAEARAAALAAKTKDKIARAIDRSLGLVEKAAGSNAGQRGAVAASARIGATLSRRAFDDGEPDAPKDATPQQRAAVRIREVANAATQPQLVIAQVRREMRHVTDPDLIAAAEKHQVALYAWLNSKMPKAPPPNPFSQKPWEPSPAAASRTARMLEVAHDPHAAFEALAQQSLTPEAAETFQRGYPLLFGMAQSRMIERAADVEHPIPYQQNHRNRLLFKVALDPSAEPATLSLLQTAHVASSPGPAAPPAAPPGTPPMSALAAPTNLTALYQTGSDRRAMR